MALGSEGNTSHGLPGPVPDPVFPAGAPSRRERRRPTSPVHLLPGGSWIPLHQVRFPGIFSVLFEGRDEEGLSHWEVEGWAGG